jgi:hypothetical protein
MSIEFFYFPDCPSHERALEILQQVLHEENVQAPVHIYRIETQQAADNHRFIGSPTIRINGQDIDPNYPHGTPYRLACRLYVHQEDGRVSPLPSVGSIRQAVQRYKT